MPKTKERCRRIFISATGQNDGKTVVSLGLICAFKERLGKIGFIKPVGQRYLIVDGEKIDEDSVLIEKSCGIQCAIKDMSPLAIEKGFTRRYILHPRHKTLVRQIESSFHRVARGNNLVVIEGTGHAGVGSVFDLSNARVARLLGSKVVIVSSGGIGRPIDEIMLNRALFEKEGVPIAGVIINKVRPDKYAQINQVVRKGLEKKGLEVLGVIPYKEILSEPTIRQMIEQLDFKLLNEDAELETAVGKILVGAMAPHDALKYFTDRSLIITPGDREDLILAIVGFQMNKPRNSFRISGIVLSGGIKPHRTILELVRRAEIPLLLAQGDTYNVASRVHDFKVKIKPEDLRKTELIKDMIERYVDVERLAKHFTGGILDACSCLL